MAFDFPTYEFTLTGTMPILVHRDNVDEADDLEAWRKDSKNKPVSVAGDDRSPPWTWQTYLYHDGKYLVIPSQNIMTALRFAGAKITGKGRTTFKALSQSGLLIPSDFCRFTNDGKPVEYPAIHEFRNEPFSVHKRRAKELGFVLDVRRATLPGTRKKHVRVRARFDHWQVSGTIHVLEQAITEAILTQMFDIAGRLSGLLDWRPSSKESPGPWGTFHAVIKLIKATKVA